MTSMLAALLVALWALPTIGSAQTTPFEGRVMRVIDGATLVVRKADKSEQWVSLRHIQVPQLCQPGGAESQQALVDLALGNDVRVQPVAKGQIDPLVAAVSLVAVAPGDVDLSRRQVEQGQAVSVLLRHDTGPLVKEERMAKALRRGLHASGHAQAVRDFQWRGGRCP